MKIKQVLFTILISAATTGLVLFGYSRFEQPSDNLNFHDLNIPANYAGFFDTKGYTGAPMDFTEAAAAAIPTVVHIKVKSTRTVDNNMPQRGNPFSDLFGDDVWDQLFGQQQQRRRSIPQRAMGSGVIISEDGYIVTNNHVVENNEEIKVTLNNGRTYEAKVVGADPNFDLAVIKIDAEGLPFMLYGNSAKAEIGQWVLAIGYPLTLEATVTAGILSAKARTLGLNSRGGNVYAVEAYLQTDAAVNMGNSGGPMVDTNGKLLGIISAIASPTGYYSGYSYAIPVDMVKKVVNDLIKYGSVQRGFLGAMYLDAGELTAQQKEANNIPASAEGIYITNLVKEGAAAQAGIEIGDELRAIDGVEIYNSATLQQQLSHYRPGDKITVTYERDGKEKTIAVTLKNRAGTYDIIQRDDPSLVLGAQLENLDKEQMREWNLEGGVIVRRINPGVLQEQTRMRDGFIIIRANGIDIKNIEELKAAIKDERHVTVTGIYPGYNETFQYPLDLSGQF